MSPLLVQGSGTRDGSGGGAHRGGREHCRGSHRLPGSAAGRTADRVERRLTLVDLGLDERIHTEFVLAQAICRTLADEFQAAELDPLLPYSPYVEGWRERREQCPQRFRRQGLPIGRLNTALDMLHISRPGGEDTLTTFGEFEPQQRDLEPDEVRSGPGAARDLFSEFDPVTRPVLWRVLVIQVLLYWCFQNVVFGQGLPDPDELKNTFIASSMHASLLGALESRPDAEAAENLTTTINVAMSYFTDRLTPALRRVQALAAANRTPSLAHSDQALRGVSRQV